MTQKLNIICRADGSHQIGLGHLMRMLALAQNLDPKRFSAHLITNSENLPPTFHAAFESITTAKKDYEEISRWSKDNTIIVLDGYTFDLGYQTRLMQAGYKVALVSDYPQEVNC
ncbi:MAG: UDP-2,4-diacetamido-2,4,6-trideoxy-beta-L-altropyranose hydrolase, partial [Arenicella sp.]